MHSGFVKVNEVCMRGLELEKIVVKTDGTILITCSITAIVYHLRVWMISECEDERRPADLEVPHLDISIRFHSAGDG